MKRYLALLVLALLLSGIAHAAIAYDSAGEGSGTSSLSWTHTPVGTLRGVFVFCANNTNADVFSAADYGGTAMTRINGATDGAGEAGFVEGYFLGASIPTGAQTVTCTVSTGTTAKWGVSIGVTAATDTQTAGTVSCVVQGDADDPSCSITSITGASFAAAGLHSGLNSESNTTAGTGMTLGPTHDYGTQTTSSEYSTSQLGSGNQTVTFVTSTSDDVAMVAIAIEQTVADVSSPPRRMITIARRSPQRHDLPTATWRRDVAAALVFRLFRWQFLKSE